MSKDNWRSGCFPVEGVWMSAVSAAKARYRFTWIRKYWWTWLSFETWRMLSQHCDSCASAHVLNKLCFGFTGLTASWLYIYFTLWSSCNKIGAPASFFLRFVINKQISASYKVHGICSLVFFISLACRQKRNKYFKKKKKFLDICVFFQNECTFLPRLLPFAPQKAQSNSCKDSFPLSSHEV